jgi:hypothetical protein
MTKLTFHWADQALADLAGDRIHGAGVLSIEGGAPGTAEASSTVRASFM